MYSIRKSNAALMISALAVAVLLAFAYIALPQKAHAAENGVFSANSSISGDLQSKIADILSKIAQLRTTLGDKNSLFGQFASSSLPMMHGNASSTWQFGKNEHASSTPWFSTGNAQCAFNFARNLKLGDRGSDVKWLQQILNQASSTQVTLPGQETDYFGPATEKALKKYQDLHKDDILKPLGLLSPNGFFGSITRSFLMKSCVNPQGNGWGHGTSTASSSQHLSLSVTLAPDKQTYAQGDVVKISWQKSAIASGTGMYAVLRAKGGNAVKAERITDPSSGSYNFTIPEASSTCNGMFSDALSNCGNYSRFNEHATAYYFEVTAFTPKDACFGFCIHNPSTKLLGTASSHTFAITLSGTSGAQATSSAAFTLKKLSRYSVQVSFNRTATTDPYTINWGDGNSVSYSGTSGSMSGTASIKRVHTYTASGTYTITVTNKGVTSTSSVAIGSSN